ncbi:MAG TPA: fructose-bisphosphate aldolase, partial [Chitinophagaceae bacterium]|nr:fructose-bisphosphate aldolase [Chitinophagaceae bacterium]
MATNIQQILGDKAEYLLNHTSKTIDKSQLHLPGADFVDRIFMQSDRNVNVLKSLQSMYSTGRLANTGYLSILPVDQGIEHSAGASFAPNPIYF